MSFNEEGSDKHKKEIRTALITAGTGPIVNSTYGAIASHSELCSIVLSNHRGRESNWVKLRKYGLWYAFQYLSSKILNHAYGYSLSQYVKSSNFDVLIWTDRDHEDMVSNFLQEQDITCVIVSDIPFILSQSFCKQFRYCINIHPSLLPDYRGPHPIMWGLLDKNPLFGITLHSIDQGIDTGDVICQREIGKPRIPLSFFVEMKLAKVLPELIDSTLTQIRSGNLQAREQEGGFYLPLPTLANRRKIKQRDINQYSR